MNIVQADQVESNPASVHRGGKSFRQNLLGAKTGVENFPFVISRSEARFSPRHRHSFEQYRYQLEGIAEYGKSGTLKPGMLGYFPEGMHYGPQTPSKDGDNLVVLALQCGGASGSGYVNRDEQLEAAKELKKIGTFKDGVFHRNPGEPGKKNLDGSQAIWEHVMKKDLVFPKPRYAAPIFMHPEHFDWVPVDGSPGVAEKLMGVFSERETGAHFIKLEPNATYAPAGNRDIYVVLSGNGTVDQEDYKFATTVFLDRGDGASFTAQDATEILHFSLPDLTGIQAH